MRSVKRQQQQKTKNETTPRLVAQKNEQAMIEGILEGSPDGVGVAVIRLDCGCRKMAAVSRDGEPASKVIMYRDGAESICPQCRADNGAFSRVLEEFIHWAQPDLTEGEKQHITGKVLGTHVQH